MGEDRALTFLNPSFPSLPSWRPPTSLPLGLVICRSTPTSGVRHDFPSASPSRATADLVHPPPLPRLAGAASALSINTVVRSAFGAGVRPFLDALSQERRRAVQRGLSVPR